MGHEIVIWLRRLGWMIVAIIAAAVVVAACVVATQVPGGGAILRERLVAGLPPVFADKQSSENRVWYQAKQRLLDEADSVEKNSSSTADDCMGVAWALAGLVNSSWPNPTIVGRMVWGAAPKNPRVDDWHEIDRTLQARAQQMAAKATSLQPEQVDWWRLRALLMVFEPGYAQIDAEALRDGLKHDPENALYEYLLAIDTMKQSMAVEISGDQGPVHTIGDRQLFESGRKLYERAAAKKTLLCGEQGWHALADFIAKVDAPPAVKLPWSCSAGFEFATEKLIQRIVAPIEQALLDDLPPMEATTLENWQTRHSTWLQQIAIAPETLWLKDSRANSSFLGRQNRWRSIEHLLSLVRPEGRHVELTNLISIAGIAAGAMAVMFLALALIGSVCLALNRKASPTSRPIGIWLSTIIFVAVLALTFGFLGMVGAYLPELREYPWPIGAFLAVVAVLVAWLFWKLSRFTWRQSRLPAEQRSPLFQFARIALVIGASIPFIVALFTLTDFKFREVARNMLLKFPSCIISQANVDYIAAESQGANWHTIDFAALEWCVRRGAFWTVGLTFLCLLRIGWRRTKAEVQHRRRLTASLGYTAKPTLWLALLLFLSSLAITAWWTSDLEHRYQLELTRLGDHAWLVKLADAQLKALDINAPQ